jgi:hypothetical protein
LIVAQHGPFSGFSKLKEHLDAAAGQHGGPTAAAEGGSVVRVTGNMITARVGPSGHRGDAAAPMVAGVTGATNMR